MNFKIGNIDVGTNASFFVMAGPCVIESRDSCLDIAKRLLTISRKTGVPVIYKASFDKANRSSLQSFRGPGLEKGLDILALVRQETGLSVMTDVHETSQVEPTGQMAAARRPP